VLRGLFIDKARGNLLKIDRFGLVGRAYHGRDPLPEETMQRLYRNERIRLKSADYAWIDTLFALPEACLYAEIIETLERRAPGTSSPIDMAGAPGTAGAPGGRRVDYHRLFDDVRETIDEVHRDGSLKVELKKDLGAFILRDAELGPTLHKLRSGGKKLLLLTNSFWDYTDAVMRHLLDGQLSEYPSWRNYFDFVVVGAQKPAFFAEQRPFVELDAGGAAKGTAESLERGVVYEGGNLFDFERLSGHGGGNVLYVGDHIYGDIIRNRKASLWRTCFVVQELEREIEYLEEHAGELARLRELDQARARLDDLINHHKLQLNALDRARERGNGPADLEPRRGRAKADLESLRRLHRAALAESTSLEENVERGMNREWGLCFKEGNENSRVGEQVEDYADLYTSRVSNFLYYSPVQYFRSPAHLLPHERSL
jgi:5'-nucleotidase